MSDPITNLRRWTAPRLLAWYRANRRDLPWRLDRDPYRIWVSEVMLQQTQVSTVVPFFHRFLAKFPTIAELAAAEQQDVLRLWEGLGYYRRARDLHAAAKLLVERHRGQIPADVDALTELPGLGQYTRNAVLSQAFDLRLPIVEANSQRVLSRLIGLAEDPKQGAGRKRLWQVAEELLPNRDIGEFNQALMELGALVCTVSEPRCGDCPLRARCVARQQGRQEEIPLRTPPPATTFVRESAVVIRREGRLLLVRRPADAVRWADLWEFPHGELTEGESNESAAIRLARELVGIRIHEPDRLTTIAHGVTRYRIEMVCYEAEAVGEAGALAFHVSGEWVTPEALAKYPVSAPQRKLAKMLGERGLF